MMKLKNIPTIDYGLLWKYVIENHCHNAEGIHGPTHWHRVEKTGLMLAKRTGADETIISMFALFHDAQRVHDGIDDNHGERGANLLKSLRGNLFDLDYDRFDKLYYACKWHTEILFDDDPSIATCFDADRLDLGRVHIEPDPQYLNTEYARAIAERVRKLPEGRWQIEE